MVKKLLFSLVLLSNFAFVQGQEVATYVTYNLLNYRNETSFCTNSNNNPLSKENYFKTIFTYLQPDLLACNEVGANSSTAIKILDRCLNVNGETKYAMANHSFTSGSDLSNAFYYNTQMFTLKSSDKVQNDVSGQPIVRLINVYTLYYNNVNLPLGADTTFLTVFVAHFKAGSGSSNATQRDKASAAVMKYLTDKNITGNFIISGDFNTYKSSEAAIQNLVNPASAPVKFIDPVNRLGSWNNNSAYADVHTQSTHATSNGCASGGGLDDRFDFVLISEAIKNDSNHMEYVKNSYKAVANDGQHFNGAINNPGNSSVPANVLDAIYNGSDHLPVVMDMIVTEAAPNSVADVNELDVSVKLINPNSGNITGTLSGKSGTYVLKVYAISGQLLSQLTLNLNNEMKFELPVEAQGILLLEVVNESGYRKVMKVIQN
tara:strand:- start:16428 stop:17723 length:1296 start_codon:yes stop_codon:yes gene_type:complete